MEISYSLSEIDIIAKKICDSLRYPVVAFNGPMGAAGMWYGIIFHLNFKENISSPTFSLVHLLINYYQIKLFIILIFTE